jgi:uncharacterized protein YcaQ
VGRLSREPVITIGDLRRLAVARSLFPLTTLQRAVDQCGFVQADPIRAPARAQDLTLRHRVRNYRAGDLERLYPTLDVEEDFFVNYGFLPGSVQALMHPRSAMEPWSKGRRARAQALLAFVRDRGTVHPREVDAYFSHGTVRNYWGGASTATTHLLDAMHYRGVLRVARREGGIRIYAAHDHPPLPGGRALIPVRVDALIDVILQAYAPLPARSLSALVSRLRFCVPQWRSDLKAALVRATRRLSHARIEGIEWYWPDGERIPRDSADDGVRLLAPFDPIVWDRRRFELLWGWAYRFEAYTPLPKRKLGYYALPMLWRDGVIGWANVTVRDGALGADFGYVGSTPPRERNFKRELEAEIERMRIFLR